MSGIAAASPRGIPYRNDLRKNNYFDQDLNLENVEKEENQDIPFISGNPRFDPFLDFNIFIRRFNQHFMFFIIYLASIPKLRHINFTCPENSNLLSPIKTKTGGSSS
jgi:hypothetical protein